MRPTKCRFVAWGLFVGTFGCGSLTAPGAKTPEDAYAVYKEANDKKDYSLLMKSMTDESQKSMVGSVAWTASLARNLGQKKSEITAVFSKHGLSEAEVTKIESKTFGDDYKLLYDTWGAPVKDRAGFLTDITAAMGSGAAPPLFNDLKGMKDLKVNGNTATATVTLTNFFFTTPQDMPLLFVKTDGWRVSPPGHGENFTKAKK